MAGGAIELANNAIVTLALFKAYFGTTSIDDDILTIYLNSASGAIQAFVGYELHRQTVTDELHHSDGNQRLLLKKYPVKSVTTVQYDDVALAADDFDAELPVGIIRLEQPKNAGDYQYPAFGDRLMMRTGRRKYKVTYEAGWITHAQSNDVGGAYENQTFDIPYPFIDACLAYAALLAGNHRLAGAGIPTRDRIGDAEREYAASLRRGAGATATSLKLGMPDWIAEKIRTFKRIGVA